MMSRAEVAGEKKTGVSEAGSSSAVTEFNSVSNLAVFFEEI